MFFKMEPSEISSGCFLAVLEKEKATSKKSAKDILASDAAKRLLDGIVEEQPKEEVKKQKVKRRRKATASDSKPKAAKLLPHQTGANVKAEVPVSKAASKIQEKNACRKKAASNSPQKNVNGKKTASNTPQKTVNGKKAASNTPQKNVHRKKAASNTLQKNLQ